MIKIGCCGFPKSREIYFKNLDCVELQNTFYQPPKKFDTIEKLSREAPPNFEFSIKAWQIITHLATSPTYRRLKEEVGASKNYGFFKSTKEVFLAYQKIYQIAERLSAKIILFQSPPNFKETKENVDSMYKFFKKIERGNLIFCWEERGNFRESTIKSICKDLNLIHAVDPFKKSPVYGDIFYFRLHGKGGYKYKYTDKDFKDLKSLVKEKPSYVLFNNVYMWEDALNFKKLRAG
ncbi:MAG: hypothetical protein B6D56_02410 [Candidatus Omnitrophica bacterium 4484_70.1]|nr:MAG: hypothetical protein B6D56_02410 [Candidatus Omnitrophica bacterium 4484_70.1]